MDQAPLERTLHRLRVRKLLIRSRLKLSVMGLSRASFGSLCRAHVVLRPRVVKLILGTVARRRLGYVRRVLRETRSTFLRKGRLLLLR